MPKDTTPRRAPHEAQAARHRARAEAMAAAIDRHHQVRDGAGCPLSLTEDAQHTAAVCELWALFELAQHAMICASGDSWRDFVPALLAAIGDEEVELRALFAGSFLQRNLKRARRRLADLARNGITDADELLLWQLRRKSRRNVPRAKRGQMLAVTWESDALAGIGIQDGDEITVVQTPDVQPGDLVCTMRPAWLAWLRQSADEVNLGVLRVKSPALYFDCPGAEHGTGDDLTEVTIIGRAVGVRRKGNPVDVAIALRPYDAGSEAR